MAHVWSGQKSTTCPSVATYLKRQGGRTSTEHLQQACHCAARYAEQGRGWRSKPAGSLRPGVWCHMGSIFPVCTMDRRILQCVLASSAFISRSFFFRGSSADSAVCCNREMIELLCIGQLFVWLHIQSCTDCRGIIEYACIGYLKFYQRTHSDCVLLRMNNRVLIAPKWPLHHPVLARRPMPAASLPQQLIHPIVHVRCVRQTAKTGNKQSSRVRRTFTCVRDEHSSSIGAWC